MIIEKNYNLKNLNTLKIDTLGKNVYFPETEDDFIQILKNNKNVKILGNGSNVLISSFNPNCDFVITSKLNEIIFENENTIKAQSGAYGAQLSKLAYQKGLSGFEFLIGFPSTVGGAVYMNASCHNQYTSDNFLSCVVYDIKIDKQIVLTKDDMQFDYRKSILQSENYIVLNATFMLNKGDKNQINEIMNRNLEFRKTHQPSLKLPNAGSIFKNPQGDSAGRLLDLSGVKVFNVNGAKVWENHANFIINENNATSLDILKLMQLMKNVVYDRYKINLEPEIEFIEGVNEEENKIWANLKSKKED